MFFKWNIRQSRKGQMDSPACGRAGSRFWSATGSQQGESGEAGERAAWAVQYRSLRIHPQIKKQLHPSDESVFFKWGKMDSNHRRHCQQIYSLSPLATREFPHIQFLSAQCCWSWWTDSNPRPADYKSAALPTELHQHLTGLTIIAERHGFVNTFFFKFFK